MDGQYPIGTSEPIIAILQLQQILKLKPEEKLSDERIFTGIDYILSMQNETGGWASYEPTRGPELLELINPAEVFDRIMIDYDHTECSASCIRALVIFKKYYPANSRINAIDTAIKRGVALIKKVQRPDGSWYGNWGVCFTYAAFFAVEALIEAGESLSSPTIQKAVQFLVSKQQEDGGWGETFESCSLRKYTQNPKSQVVNTAWVLLVLMKVNYYDKEVIRRGIEVLKKRQLANGDWTNEDTKGVFNANCGIYYVSYKNVFPLWALSRYTNLYEKKSQ